MNRLLRNMIIGSWSACLILAGRLLCLGDNPPASSRAPKDWYYGKGPLRGSLRSEAPLPLYDADTNHLWNRLFAVFYIRPSELPARPNYPADTTQLDAWDHKMRNGNLPPGPIIRRIEGGDVSAFLAWPKTRHFSTPEGSSRANQLLDEFLATHAEQLITNPLKRAFLQRDLWAVFDHLARQNIDRFGDADLARRRAPVPDYKIEPDELRHDDPEAMRRREILCRKLALVIKRLALPRRIIASLPDTYDAAVRSGAFPDHHDFDGAVNYLPSGLLTRPEEWVEIDNVPSALHHDPREGSLSYTTWSIRGRSYYRVFWRFPEGRPAVEAYLDYLQRDGVNWEQSARQGYIALKKDARQIPVGTETAIVQFMIVLDEDLQPVPTRVVELVHVLVYKNVDGSPDPLTNTGRGLMARQYVVLRRLLFDELNQGGLARRPDDAPTYRTLLTSPRDWGMFGRQQAVAQTCLHCHMYEQDRVGIFSINSVTCFVPEHGMPGIVIPMGSGEIKIYSKAERTARWKLGQEEYLRLVEFARPSSGEP